MDAENCIKYINGTRLDDRVVRADWDAGFVEGRQYGRGKTGGQVRDEYRTDYDPGRGGFGKIVQQRVAPAPSSAAPGDTEAAGGGEDEEEGAPSAKRQKTGHMREADGDEDAVNIPADPPNPLNRT